MFSKYDICNRALGEIGCKLITSFDDGTTESDDAGATYEPMLTAKLSVYPWNFAKKQFKLSQSEDVPLTRWSFYYQQPSDLVVLRAVLDAAGLPVIYDRYEDQIATNYDGDLFAEYTYRAPEALFPPYFVEAFAIELAAHFARSIRRDEAEGKRLDDIANLSQPGKPSLWAKARTTDSQQQSSKKLPQSRFVTVRGARGFLGGR